MNVKKLWTFIYISYKSYPQLENNSFDGALRMRRSHTTSMCQIFCIFSCQHYFKRSNHFHCGHNSVQHSSSNNVKNHFNTWNTCIAFLYWRRHWTTVIPETFIWGGCVQARWVVVVDSVWGSNQNLFSKTKKSQCFVMTSIPNNWHHCA